MNLDKTQVARRHLGTALALFLDDLDPVSVHTLACAGCEVAEHLTRKAGTEPFSTHALATFPSLDIQKIRRLQNQYWKAFKHATTRDGVERADQELLDRFDDDTTIIRSLSVGTTTCLRPGCFHPKRRHFKCGILRFTQTS